MRLFGKVILLAAISFIFISPASAQISLDNLPDAQGNSRFYSDEIAQVKHPSLTLDGFDSGPENGYGLKQVLEEVYSSSPDPSVRSVWNDIVILASDGGFNHSPSSIKDIKANTQRLQARAFVALATYVIERNGEEQIFDNLPPEIDTHAEAADRLRSALLNTDAWRIVKDWKKDGVKWTTPLENMARTLDLYLALENAYCYYGDQGHTPSQQECTAETDDRPIGPQGVPPSLLVR